MTSLQLIFLFVGLVTFIASVMVVTSPRLIHAGLWLVLALGGVAGLFVLLQAPFLAVVQVVIYIGAITILIIFAIMLTRRVMEDTGPQVNQLWWAAAVISIVLFAVLAFLINSSPRLSVSSPELPSEPSVLLQDLGRALVDVDRFVLPFEMASVLLLAAMIGAILIARPPSAPEEAEE